VQRQAAAFQAGRQWFSRQWQAAVTQPAGRQKRRQQNGNGSMHGRTAGSNARSAGRNQKRPETAEAVVAADPRQAETRETRGESKWQGAGSGPRAGRQENAKSETAGNAQAGKRGRQAERRWQSRQKLKREPAGSAGRQAWQSRRAGRTPPERQAGRNRRGGTDLRNGNGRCIRTRTEQKMQVIAQKRRRTVE